MGAWARVGSGLVELPYLHGRWRSGQTRASAVGSTGLVIYACQTPVLGPDFPEDGTVIDLRTDPGFYYQRLKEM
ncbi:uncharacterized protein BT62DRAFT_936736, partial [Guyanagaster necrorhizus]